MDHLEIIQEEEDVSIDTLFVPNVNSNDPDERKLARRIRIQRRIEAMARKDKGIEQLRAEKAAERVNHLQRQLDDSSDILHGLFKEAEHQVTNVRVANDRREVDRREQDAVRRGKIYAHLQQDAKLSMQMFDEIASKWDTIMTYKDPINMYEDLQAQREKCDELLKQKDFAINMIKHELHETEARFFRDQKCQNTDIHLLAKRVERQVTIMRAAHAVEQQAIEDVMIRERDNLMENDNKRWNEMYKRRKELELSISTFKDEQQHDFEETVTNVRIRHYEKLREVKITLERNCGQLQKEFQLIKMNALINSEKMDYNYQILKKREDENVIIKGNQKRLINQLLDTINVLRNKIKQYEDWAKSRVSKLGQDIHTIQKRIRNQRTKTRATAFANDKIYNDVWEFNRRSANKVLKRIQEIDKLLCIQQLGISWTEPRTKLQVKEKLPSFKEAVKVLQARYGNAPHVPKLKKIRLKKSSPVAVPKNFDTNFIYKRLLHIVLEKVADSGGFLLEPKIDEILTQVTRNQEVLVKVESVLDALGINLDRDVKLMVHFFRPYIYCPTCTLNLHIEDEDDLYLSSTDTTMTQGMLAGSAATDRTLAIGVNAIALLGTSELQKEFGNHDRDEMVDTIVASIVDPKRLRGSTSQLDLVHKVGECIGPGQLLAEAEKRMAQVGDHVTVIGDADFENCVLNHTLYMNPSMVMRALREFVNVVKCKSDGRIIIASDTDMAQTTKTLSRLLDRTEVNTYWDRYGAILEERTLPLWVAFEYGLKKYHAILEERHRLNEVLKTLHKENSELRFLLKRFHSGNIPKPPCAVERQPNEVMQEKDFHPDLIVEQLKK